MEDCAEDGVLGLLDSERVAGGDLNEGGSFEGGDAVPGESRKPSEVEKLLVRAEETFTLGVGVGVGVRVSGCGGACVVRREG